MMNNVALNVVIGLVFVYLLYSLYATVLMEIVASSFGLRAKNLSYALRRMLMDEKKYESVIARKLSRLYTTFIQIFGKATNLTNSKLFNDFNSQPSIKYLSNGGFNNKPSYLSPELFSKTLIESIKVDDAELSPLARIELGLEQMSVDTNESETKKHILSLLEESNNDLVKFRLLLENWYNETMDRATGWYKRSTQLILFLIGFVIVFIFNVDTIAIIKKLSTNKDAREQMAQMATQFVNDNADLVEAVRAKKTSNDTTLQQLNQKLDSLQAIRNKLETDISATQDILSADWSTTLKGEEDTFGNRMSYIFTFKHVWGYLLTVLALSLGAPFWFDLLNKLVKLRTSKAITPTESDSKSGGAAASNRVTLNRAG